MENTKGVEEAELAAKNRVSDTLRQKWKKKINERLDAVGSIKCRQAQASAKDSPELRFAIFEKQVEDSPRAAKAWSETMAMARKNPELLMEAVEMDASAVELLITAGDWAGGLELLALAPEALCLSPKRRLGLVSCAQRGSLSNEPAAREAGVRMWISRALDKKEELGPRRLRALTEECELIISQRQEWTERERLDGGRLFLGYASNSGAGWSERTRESLREFLTRVEKEAIEKEIGPARGEPARGAKFL